jgi:AraC-like DNA-binding protein
MPLEVFSDLSERISYNLSSLPLYVRRGELRFLDQYRSVCHWHPDLEYILVLDGGMFFSVNGQIVRLEKGQGIFVNSKRLHYSYSDDNTNCSYIIVVIHPSVLGDTPAGKSFFDMKFGLETDDFILLQFDVLWQEYIITQIKQLFDERQTVKENPFRLLSLVASICGYTADNLQQKQDLKSAENKKMNFNSLMAITNMTSFIFQNYSSSISLDDIATAGSVCRSKCCMLFSEFVGQSPNAYLSSYRLRKSCEMLKESNMSILEISLACGFQSPSYFTHIFRKEMGITPKEYRKQAK